jgi:hypothetical protein
MLGDVIFGAIGAGLAYLVVSAGVAGALANERPDIATRLWPGPAGAGVVLGETRLRGGDAKAALDIARWALSRDPLNVAALRVAGLAYETQGAAAPAENMLRFAGSRGWRDIPTRLWLVRRNIIEGRFADGVADADAILRQSDDAAASTVAVNVLVAAANDPPAVQPLADRLALRPAWRWSFLAQLAESPQDRTGANAVLSALRSSRAPPTAGEVVPYLDRLVAQKRYGEALSRWRALAPAAPGADALLRDGDFDGSPDGTPFTWSTSDAEGAVSTIERRPDDPRRSALRVEYDGFSLPPLPRQLMVLPPGGYRVTGKALTEIPAENAGLRWTVTCADSQRLLAHSEPLGAVGGEEAFALDVLPTLDCPAQWLGLAAIPAERRDKMVIWFDDIRVQLATGAGPPELSQAGPRPGASR